MLLIVIVPVILFILFLLWPEDKRDNIFFKICSLSVPVLLFFFYQYVDSSKLLLECDKKTMICAYSEATRASPELKLREKYDIREVSFFSSVRSGRRAGRFIGRCKITANKNNGRHYEIPFAQNCSETDKTAEEMNRFLSSDEQEYRYYKEKDFLSWLKEII